MKAKLVLLASALAILAGPLPVIAADKGTIRSVSYQKNLVVIKAGKDSVTLDLKKDKIRLLDLAGKAVGLDAFANGTAVRIHREGGKITAIQIVMPD